MAFPAWRFMLTHKVTHCTSADLAQGGWLTEALVPWGQVAQFPSNKAAVGMVSLPLPQHQELKLLGLQPAPEGMVRLHFPVPQFPQ